MQKRHLIDTHAEAQSSFNAIAMTTSALPTNLPSPSPSYPLSPFLSHPSTVPTTRPLNLQPPQPLLRLRILRRSFTPRAALNLSRSLFEDEEEYDEADEPPLFPFGPGSEDKPDLVCPPGLRQYESMVVLRPDLTEDERLGITQKYEELLVAGGGMYVEVFNRGVIPLAYSIKKKNRDGDTNTYLDGIYLLFTFFTNPESMAVLEDTLKRDDDVIRSMSFKVRKRKY